MLHECQLQLDLDNLFQFYGSDYRVICFEPLRF